MDKLMSRIGWAIILTVVLPLGYGGLCDKGDSNSSSGAFLSEIGTVRFIDIEGGFYGINGDTGQNYDPINLGTEFQTDGLRVRFKYKRRDDRGSIHMWGIVIEIVEISKL